MVSNVNRRKGKASKERKDMTEAFKVRSNVLRTILIALILVIIGALSTAPAFAGATLDKVRSMGMVRCGISEEMKGFSYKDTAGRWQGFTVDFCRAVAAAALGDAEKTTLTPLTPSSRLPVLLSGGIDLLAHTATVTFGREAGIGVLFAGIYFYDGQTFMVPRKGKKIRKIEDLNRATICVQKGTTHQANLENAFRARRLSYKPLVIDSLPDVTKAFFSGQCQAYTADRSDLAAVLLSAPGGPAQFEILPGNISKEPLGPAVRRGDDEWLTLVRWVLFGLIEAEERGVTRENVQALRKKTDDPALQWFLNSSGQLGKSLGLKPAWVADVVAQVGNYGEIYERNLGSRSALKIERGLNRLWTQGGLLYAPPFQ
jgi:general L-amino acid transport system substrate-binding protein